MVDPATATLVAAAIQSIASGIGGATSASAQRRADKRQAKETKRETFGGLLNETAQHGADLESNKIEGRKKMGKSKVKSHLNTAEVVRGALKI